MELIEQLQEILWELMNQRLDNVELINNAIMLIRTDVDDPDAFEHYPGARWPVDAPLTGRVRLCRTGRSPRSSLEARSP
jgi:hypothetical protein